MKFATAILCLFFTSITFAQNVISYRTTETTHEIESYYDPALKPFYHGVASGDPISDAVIIWTRVTPEMDGIIDVSWRVATDVDMTNIIAGGNTSTDINKDYTVKIDVTGLSPATTYYYDFTALDATSIVGRTRTAPTGEVDNVRMAVVSCSNYQAGFFNVYKEIAQRDDLDVVVHLGDYIYEYETGGYGYTDEMDRKHLPDNEIVSLDDYRIRYSFYRLDPDLRAVHQQHPFITVWDDHEFTNDAYMDGAENHDSTEGDWELRKSNAYTAYFDWLPIRENSIEPNRIYRKISYGNLADLFMLDTRIEGREKQIELFSSTVNSITDEEENARLSDEGKIQKEKEIKSILRENLNRHYSTTNDIYSKTALTPSEVEEIVDFLYNQAINNAKNTNSIQSLSTIGHTTLEKDKLQRIQGLVKKGTSSKKKETATIAENHQLDEKFFSELLRRPEIYSDAQKDWLLDGMVNSNAKWKILGNQTMFFPLVPPVNLDQWDGYTKSRNELLQTIRTNNLKNTVVITGDIHTSWAAEVPTNIFNYSLYNQSPVAVEFITPSITSDNGSVLGSFLASIGEFVLDIVNPHVKSVNLTQHGYFLLDLNDQRAKAIWQFMNIDTPNYTLVDGFAYETLSGTQRLTETDASLMDRTIGKPSPELPVKAKVAKSEDNEMMVVGLYPNPVETSTQLHYVLNNASNVTVNVYNTNGEIVKNINKEQDKGTYTMVLDLNSFKNGNYIVQVLSNGKKVATKNIMKK